MGKVGHWPKKDLLWPEECRRLSLALSSTTERCDLKVSHAVSKNLVSKGLAQPLSAAKMVLRKPSSNLFGTPCSCNNFPLDSVEGVTAFLGNIA
jgi:hypothetical protein